MARRAGTPRIDGAALKPAPALLDVRVVLVAAVVASPAAYRASQGLLTPDQALGRFLAVFLAVAAMTVLVRALWPLVAGTSAAVDAEAAATEPGTEPETATDGVSPPPG